MASSHTPFNTTDAQHSPSCAIQSWSRTTCQCIEVAVQELMSLEGIGYHRFQSRPAAADFPDFIARVGEILNIPADRLVDVTGGQGDYFTSSLPYAFDTLRKQKLVEGGDVGLIIAVGSGVQAGCAAYYF